MSNQLNQMSNQLLTMSELNLYISEELNRQLLNAAKELAKRAIMWCSERYNFDGEQAVRELGIDNVKIERQKPVAEKKVKEIAVKAAFPLPYNGEMNDSCCYALRQNNGLYTQCQGTRKADKEYCKACQVNADKNEGSPEYGTIQQRQACGVFEYVDPKGRKPTAYVKIMKKFKVSEEQVIAEAGKFGIEINPEHFKAIEVESKRGRPKVAAKATEPKGPKGRPKKSKKVMEIVGDEDDLFASLVEDANSNDDAEPDNFETLEKEAKKKALEEEKAAKEAQKKALEEEKAAKKKALEEEKAAKEAQRKALEEEKAAKKKALEEEKAAKEAQRKALEEEKAAKKKAVEEEKAAKKKASESKPAKKASKASSEDEEEGIRVKAIKVDGVKYLLSEKTGIVYDYKAWTEEEEQTVVGTWNAEEKKIIAKKSESESEVSDSEEEEEEYEN